MNHTPFSSRSAAPQSLPILTPSQLNAVTRDLLESTLYALHIEGEISNFYRHSSGHVYFTLKDANTAVKCAMFKTRALLCKVPLRDGLQVVLKARASLYEPRGEFQLQVESVEEAGLGALKREFERLKTVFAREGLFDPSRKKTLPKMPRRLGILSSAGGAAIHDVLSVLARRFPLLSMELLPVPVQGEGAAEKIEQMLRQAIDSGRYDVLLITRGGGSIEDLWAFNDERLARRVATSPIPIVAAIGHEIDVTLVELVADLRAATPTAAAELISPDAADLARQLARFQQQLRLRLQRTLETQAQRSDYALARLRAHHPLARLRLTRLRAQHALQQLTQLTQARILQTIERLKRLGVALEAKAPQQRLPMLRMHVDALQRRLSRVTQARLAQQQAKLREHAAQLHTVSPLATLARGYSLIQSDGGHWLMRAEQTASKQHVEIRFADGTVGATLD